MNENTQPSNQEILNAINEFADKTEERFLKSEKDIGFLKSNMLTKDYLD